MNDFNLSCWREVHRVIEKFRCKGRSWDEIKFGCKNDETGLRNFIDAHEDEWPDGVTNDIWMSIVEYDKKAEEHFKDVEFNCCQGIAEKSGENNGLPIIPDDPKSAWQLYRKYLIEKKNLNEDKVKLIEKDAWDILRKLSLDTTNRPPVKGMVVGNVQSGKTANMAALMSMAADYGWNVFIVLSGTIENLRKQTYERLNEDLKSGYVSWYPLGGQLNPKTEPKLQQLPVDNSRQRFYTVCLKNSKRLENLIKWLHSDPNKMHHMKMLIIDDEADQAGINTAAFDKERTAINRHLCNLVAGNNAKGQPGASKFQAVNYVGYTATPYACFLNEIGRDKNGLDSIFPEDFVATLAVSKEYFGPQQIFGVDGTHLVKYDGLGIVKTILSDEIECVKKICNGESSVIPQSLQNSVLWFLCCSACLRFWQYKKPISMLVHTSQNTTHHQLIYESIKNWLDSLPIEDRIQRCQERWDIETKVFPFSLFKEQYPDYGVSDSNSSPIFEEVRDYPSFKEIKPFLEELLNAGYDHIKFDSEDEKLDYKKGIHFCIDNCKNGKITDEGEHVRLAYPDKEQLKELGFAPVFLVVGGATLSRGLTIEGLVSTFFLRTVALADTLMQMGRWFGYRKGYELLPRIWLSSKTQDHFRYLSELDQELREEIMQMNIPSIIPGHTGVKVKSSAGKGIKPTAKNKMKGAEAVSWDYSGVFKETYRFPNNLDMLKSNIGYAEEFLGNLHKDGSVSLDVHEGFFPFIWRNVDFSLIQNFFSKFHFEKRLQPFDQIDRLCEWIVNQHEKGVFKKWNVILAGLRKPDLTRKELEWKLPFGSVYKINRSKKIGSDTDDFINIGYLSATSDIVADVDKGMLSDEVRKRIDEMNSKKAVKQREIAGLAGVPQLIVYRIDKDSTYVPKESVQNDGELKRTNLNSKEDLIGLCVLIPGARERNGNFAAALRIKLPEILPDEIIDGVDDYQQPIK